MIVSDEKKLEHEYSIQVIPFVSRFKKISLRSENIFLSAIESNMKKIGHRFYLPQLDGLRFLAFLLVFLHHAPWITEFTPSYPRLFSFFMQFASYGWCGVDLFLCLSAFLITKLLRLELKFTDTLSIKNFYIRRSLRIWPLYYFVCILGFFVFYFIQSEWNTSQHKLILRDHLFPCLLFMENWSVGISGFPNSSTLGMLWTISLEEQYYLVWPALVYFFRSNLKQLFYVLICLFLFSMALKFYLLQHGLSTLVVWTNTFTRLEPLILGSAIAFYSEGTVKFLHKSRNSYLLCSLGLFFFFKLQPNVSLIGSQSGATVLSYWLSAVGSAMLLLSVLSKNNLSRLLCLRPLRYLGKISYGLYIFHKLGISSAYMILAMILPFHLVERNGLKPWMLLVALSFGITVLFASISYRLLEYPFLKLKGRFTSIQSRAS